MDPWKEPTCNEPIAENRLKELREKLPDTRMLLNLSELFKIFSDPTRVRILCVLVEQELCVCEIAAALDMTPSAISHQLRIIRTARLIKSRRAGKTIYYALADDHVRQMITMAEEHLKEPYETALAEKE